MRRPLRARRCFLACNFQVSRVTPGLTDASAGSQGPETPGTCGLWLPPAPVITHKPSCSLSGILCHPQPEQPPALVSQQPLHGSNPSPSVTRPTSAQTEPRGESTSANSTDSAAKAAGRTPLSPPSTCIIQLTQKSLPQMIPMKYLGKQNTFLLKLFEWKME